MAQHTDIKDSSGMRLGYIETDGTRQTVYDSGSHRLGWYDSRDNITYEAGGCRVGIGNLLTTLLR